jgi:hypothetical protein
MKSDNCYGPSSDNILPIFLGSILELFTSTSNILILMICGAQFRNELIEIIHLKKFCVKEKQRPERSETFKTIHRQANIVALPLHIILSTTTSSSQNESNKKPNISHDPSMDSLLLSGQNKDDISITDTEHNSDETSQYFLKLSTV